MMRKKSPRSANAEMDIMDQSTDDDDNIEDPSPLVDDKTERSGEQSPDRKEPDIVGDLKLTPMMKRLQKDKARAEELDR
jgi:hypothetical protein